jgi:hypothetical protein
MAGSIPSTVRAFTAHNRHNPKSLAKQRAYFTIFIEEGEEDTWKVEIYTDLLFIPYQVTGSHLNMSCRNVSELFRELRFHYDTKDGFCKRLGILCYSEGTFYA